jgi:hypothetical protein
MNTRYRLAYHRRFIGVALGTSLAGCATAPGTTSQTPAPTTNAVYAAAVALTAADTLALQYVVLPLCGPTHAKPLCSEASITTQIKSAAQTAHDAVRAAEKSGDATAAQAAVAKLEALTPK